MKFACPTCLKTLQVADMAALNRHVKGCGKGKGKVKAKEVTPARTKFVVPRLPIQINCTRPLLSQNAHHGRHWRAKSKEADAWKAHLEPYLTETGLVGLSLTWSKWRLIRVIHAPARSFDYANLVGGAKPVPDALIYHGVVKDDKVSCFECAYGEITVADLGDEPESTQTILTLLEARL